MAPKQRAIERKAAKVPAAAAAAEAGNLTAAQELAAKQRAHRRASSYSGLTLGLGLLLFAGTCAEGVAYIPGWYLGGLPRAALAAGAVALSWTAGGFVSRYFGVGQ